MIDLAMQIFSGSPMDNAMAWTAGWLIRGSLFLVLLILLAGPFARTRSSGVRHLLWAAGFAAVVALPLASIGLPRLEVIVPASVLPSAAKPDSSPMSVASTIAGPSSTAVSSSTSIASVAEEGRPVVSDASARNNFGFPWSSAEEVGGEGRQDRGAGWDLSSLPRILFLVWLVGAAFLLLRFVASMVRTEGIVHRGDPVERPEWERTLFELSDRMDLAHAPRLVESEEVALPMTCGILKPTIVIPREAAEWSQERLEAVLCHELAHIRRRDLLSHALGHIGSALYWVNPLTWKAARNLRAECERACDDLVLSLGYRPSAYADHLLQIATFGHRASAPVAALPMARPGEFEQRLLSILAPMGDRSHPRGWHAAGVALGVVAVALPFAVLAPAAGAAAANTHPSETVDEGPGGGSGGWSGEFAAMGSDRPSNDTLVATAMQGHDILVTIAKEEHLTRLATAMEEHEVLQARSLEIHVGDSHSDPAMHASGAGFPNSGGNPIDLGNAINFDALAAFVHGVTSFAGAVASDAISEAFSEWDADGSSSRGSVGQDRAEGSFTRTLSLSGPLELEVGTGSGGIEVREGNVDRVEIRGTVRISTRNRGSSGAEAALRRLIASPPIEQNGNEVRIGRIDDRSLQDGVSISYELVVPVRSSIMASTGSGGVGIRGVQGDVRASTGSGSVTLTGIRGEVYTRTGSGSIRASQITGSFDGGTGSGSIDLTLQGAGNVSLTTGSGSVSASGVRGTLRAESGSGRITVDGEIRGPWELITGSGSVRVGLPPQAAFNLVARAGSGTVDIDHPITMMGRIDPRRQEVIGTVRGGGPDLHIRTGSGGIQID